MENSPPVPTNDPSSSEQKEFFATGVGVAVAMLVVAGTALYCARRIGTASAERRR